MPRSLRTGEPGRLLNNLFNAPLEWPEHERTQRIENTFGSERRTVLEQGGHLGNLVSDNVQHAISTGLVDMKAA